MKLTPEEQQVFQGLAESRTGEVLAGYITRLCDQLCDLRTMNKDVSDMGRLARIEAADILEKHLINLLSLGGKRDKTNKEYI